MTRLLHSARIRAFLGALCLIASLALHAQSGNITVNKQVFKLDTLYPASGSTGLNFPWEITYGPDDSLWVTEARGYKVYKIHPGNKGYRSVLNIFSTKNFSEGDGNIWPQGGLEGLAIHPQFNAGKRYVYLAYVYSRTGSCPNGTSSPCYFKSQVVRYLYPDTGSKAYTLCYPDTLLTNLSGSNDHNSGRLAIGPLESDGKYHLYYTIGDMGAGQFNNSSRTNNAQDTTIYEGKVMRLNTEPDAAQTGTAQWIPDDNPFPSTGPVTSKLAIYSYGHRNAQGLVWGNVAGTWRLYSSENMDRSDDEINIIEAGRNYGWPKVSGLCDNNYNTFDAYTTNDKLAGKTIGREDTFCTSHNVREPIFPFFAASPSVINGFSNSDIFTWWTIAPSGMDFYSSSAIPGWQNSLLVSSLKYGLYRLKLNSTGDGVTGDTINYLHGNRIRDLAIAPTGDTLFFSVDKSGSTSGPTGGFSGGSISTPNAGFILRMVYITTLPLPDLQERILEEERNAVRIYPNPATHYVMVQGMRGTHKPLSVELVDITGKTVLKASTGKDQFAIAVDQFVPGLYILRLRNGYGVELATRKILIRK